MATYLFQGAAIPLVAEVGEAVSFKDILQQQFGPSLGGYTEFYIAYEGTAFLSTPTPPDKYSYWNPEDPALTTWNVNGVPIGETAPHQTPLFNPLIEIPDTNVIHVTAENLEKTTLVAGNVILPSAYFLVPIALDADGNPTEFLQYTIATVEGEQLYSSTADEGAPTPSDVVAAAERYDAAYHDVPNNDDCHFIAQDVAAAAGAALNDQTEYGIPSSNVSGGFWRVAYRASDYSNPIDDWQTLVQAGDIVRMGWSGGGDHTTTVLSKNPDVSITVFDNADFLGNKEIINIHTVNYEQLTNSHTITIYRLSPDHLYLINGNLGGEYLAGTVYADEIHSAGDSSTLRGGPENDVLYGVLGDTAIYDGDRWDYAVKLLSNGAVQVTDLRPDAPDGTDTDFDFSSFQFADGTYSVSDLLSEKEPLGRFVSQRTHDLRADHEDHHGKPEHHGGIGHNMSEFVHQLHDLLL